MHCHHQEETARARLGGDPPSGKPEHFQATIHMYRTPGQRYFDTDGFQSFKSRFPCRHLLPRCNAILPNRANTAQ
jgi:hypothetical protein